MNPKMRPLALMLPFFMSSAAFAANGVMDDIVVTATRTAQTTDESLQATVVITRQEIERSGARDIMGLLDMQPGISVARTGGAGKTTGVYVRGTNTKHVLVLVDGVRAASASLGEYDWNALSPDQIERVEIVLGPRASIYGSDAVGGVIQIFTRKQKGGEVSLKVGSQGTRALTASIGGGENWHYGLTAGKEETDGVSTFTNERQRRGFDRTFAGVSLDGKLAEDLSLTARLNQSWGRSNFDIQTGDIEFTNRTASLKLDQRVNEIWRQSLVLGHQLDRSESFSLYTPATIETDRQSLSWQHDISMLGGLTSLGVDYWNDHVTKDRSGQVDESIANGAFFVQHQFSALGSDWQVAGRRDKHEVFGGHNTWNVSWGKALGGGFRLTSAYGTAFKAPSVNDLFWPYSIDYFGPYSFFGSSYSDTYITRGNVAARPETSKTAELGLRYQGVGLYASVNFYETKLRDLIQWTYDYTITGGNGTVATPYLQTFDYYPENIGRARIRGSEIVVGTEIEKWDVKLVYNGLLTRDLDNDRQLDRRPKNAASLKAVRSFGAHRVRFETEGVSERVDANGARRLDGYALFHAGYEYAYSKATTIGVRIENMFDREYAIARTSSQIYQTPGRSIFLTLRHTAW